MKGRNKILLIIGCIGLLLGLVGYILPQAKPQNPLRIYYDTIGGAVLFPHEDHVGEIDTVFRGAVDLACSDCHHELVIADEWIDCSECHDKDYVSEDLEHRDLVDIHAPQCSICHASLEEDMVGVEEKGCTNTDCHEERAKADLVHDLCDQCHEELKENTYIKENIFVKKSGEAKPNAEGKENTNVSGAQEEEITYCALCHLKTQ
jgi:hypothetical protein